MATWVRPGGWLLAEEVDIFPGLAAPPSIWRRYWEATDLLPGVNLRVGRALAGELQALRLDDVDLSVTVPTIHGGDRLARMYRLSLQAVIPRYLDAGLLTQAEVDEFCATMEDPNLLVAGMAGMAAWGAEPASRH